MLKDADMDGSLGLTLWGSAAENVNVVLNVTIVITTVLVRDQALCSTQQTCIEVCCFFDGYVGIVNYLLWQRYPTCEKLFANVCVFSDFM